MKKGHKNTEKEEVLYKNTRSEPAESEWEVRVEHNEGVRQKGLPG